MPESDFFFIISLCGGGSGEGKGATSRTEALATFNKPGESQEQSLLNSTTETYAQFHKCV